MAVYSSGAACARGSLRTLAHTATHSWQMYARGKALGFENSLSSGPSGLRQNEQRRTSDSPPLVGFMVQSTFTGYSARPRAHHGHPMLPIPGTPPAVSDREHLDSLEQFAVDDQERESPPEAHPGLIGN